MASGKSGGYMNNITSERSGELDCEVGLGLRMQNYQHHQQQRSEPYPVLRKIMMASGSSGGPLPWHNNSNNNNNNNGTNNNNHNNSESTSNCSTSSSRSPSPSFGRGNNGPFPFTFNQLGPSSNVHSYDDYGSSGGGAATRGGGMTMGMGMSMTFTAGQRQELERQTLIYKQMMSSSPVPPELLLPLAKSSDIPLLNSVGRRAGAGKNADMRYGGGAAKGGDPEPWRCRRTDGKKWRCSRDVAPDQKYCERHSHKGRPSRSRKPVESILSPHAPTNAAASTTHVPSNPINLGPQFELSNSQYNPNPRFPDWFMKKDVTPASVSPNPQQLGGGGSGCDLDTAGYDRKTVASLAPLDEDHSCLLPRPFIDAWSLADLHKDASNAGANITPDVTATTILPLTLSVSAGIDTESREHSTRDDGGVNVSVQGGGSGSRNCQHPLNWMTCWIGSQPGGPLAEALCLGMSGAGNGMASNTEELLSPHGSSNISTNSGGKSSDTAGAQGFYLR